MKVLVTGSAGFIGSHVVERLHNAGYEVDGFDHRGRGTVLGDIRDVIAVGDAMSHVDAFIHLAGLLGTQEHIQDPGPIMETNILGGLNVLQAAAKFKLPGVCIGVGNHFMDNPYSISKSAVERMVSMFNAERGTKVNIVRAMNAYGPGQVPAQPYGPSRVRKIAPSFICRAMKGDPIEVYGDGSQISDMVYVGDVADALIKAMEAALNGKTLPVIEVGPKTHTTVMDVALLVKELTGSASPIICLPKRPGEKEGAPVFAKSETLELIGMSDRGLMPLRDGLMLAIDHYRVHA